MLGFDGTAALGVVTLLCNDFCFGCMSRANSLAFENKSSKRHFPPEKALKRVSVLSLLKFTPENGKIRFVISSYPMRVSRLSLGCMLSHGKSQWEGGRREGPAVATPVPRRLFPKGMLHQSTPGQCVVLPLARRRGVRTPTPSLRRGGDALLFHPQVKIPSELLIEKESLKSLKSDFHFITINVGWFKKYLN